MIKPDWYECSIVQGVAHCPLLFEAVQDGGRSTVFAASARILAAWMTGGGGFHHEPDTAMLVSARAMSQGLVAPFGMSIEAATSRSSAVPFTPLQ